MAEGKYLAHAPRPPARVRARTSSTPLDHEALSLLDTAVRVHGPVLVARFADLEPEQVERALAHGKLAEATKRALARACGRLALQLTIFGRCEGAHG